MTNSVAISAFGQAEAGLLDLISGVAPVLATILTATLAIYAVVWLIRKARSVAFGR